MPEQTMHTLWPAIGHGSHRSPKQFNANKASTLMRPGWLESLSIPFCCDLIQVVDLVSSDSEDDEGKQPAGGSRGQAQGKYPCTCTGLKQEREETNA